MKITHEPGLELGPGYYWCVARDRGMLTKVVTRQAAGMVLITGEHPFLKHDYMGDLACPDEVHLLEHADIPPRTLNALIPTQPEAATV